jgi:hypothetical protein
MFKLEEEIERWRQKLSAIGLKSPAILDELEEHLREDIERQVTSGISERKAFEDAIIRMGQAHALKREFDMSSASSPMKNPWTLNPLLICATPIVGGLLQIIILGISAEIADNVHRQRFAEEIALLVLFLPLVSLLPLAAAVGGLKATAIRGWYAAGVVLNAGYCLFLWVPIRTLIMMYTA